MKVLLVEPFGRRICHSPQYARDTSLILAEAGADVTLVTFDGVLGDWMEQDARVKHISVLSVDGTSNPLLRFLSRLTRSVFFLRPFNLAFDTFFTFFLVARRNARQGYDVVHVLDASMPVLGFLAFAAVVKNYNLAFTLHSSEHELRNNAVEKLGFVNTVKNFLYRKAIRKNHIAFICFSEIVRDSFKRSPYYGKISYVPQLMPRPSAFTKQEAREHLHLPQQARILLSFGINHGWKNYEVIFQAVRDLPRDFRLLFVGKILPGNAERNDPRRFAREYDLIDNTIIVDEYVPREEVPYYYCAADAIILSYRKVFSSHSTALLDASQYSLPVIAVATGTTGEDVKAYNLGLTFIPEDAHSLRTAISSFLKLGEDEKAVMRQGLQKFAGTFSWGEATRSHIGVYQSLMEEKR